MKYIRELQMAQIVHFIPMGLLNKNALELINLLPAAK